MHPPLQHESFRVVSQNATPSKKRLRSSAVFNKKIMFKLSFLFILFINIITSCAQKPNRNDIIRNQIVEHTGIKVSNFTIVNIKSSYAIGDYSESFLIKFNSLEFKLLIQNVIKSKNYSDIIIPKTSLNVNKPPKKRWQKYESGYKFEIDFPQNNKHVIYYINEANQTLYYTSIEE